MITILSVSHVVSFFTSTSVCSWSLKMQVKKGEMKIEGLSGLYVRIGFMFDSFFFSSSYRFSPSLLSLRRPWGVKFAFPFYPQRRPSLQYRIIHDLFLLIRLFFCQSGVKGKKKFLKASARKFHLLSSPVSFLTFRS